ncbi:hypothetical protein CLCR_03684 [Cladophialophora carrionii]|uniref:Uncharacterized protein n=1 Tax=Cladophialophora carrionii TaxID=86049 RepID=A0A1C1CGF6_9EURO|nr:hypothetical protein CLCR_03684 [Cladophialophora carrionii]
MEDHLGVTWVDSPRDAREQPVWPVDVDVKWATRELHSLLHRVQGTLEKAAWQSSFASWLLETEDELMADTSLQQKAASVGLRGAVESIASGIDSLHGYLETGAFRLQSQIGLLFNVVGQRDALINFEIGSSAKQDSISMATFTFIAAIFLPPTFVATLFSMGMFDWSDGDGGDGHLSDSFWVFWALAVPLTATTILCWYLWYRHAYRKWQNKFGRRRPDEREGSDAVGS